MGFSLESLKGLFFRFLEPSELASTSPSTCSFLPLLYKYSFEYCMNRFFRLSHQLVACTAHYYKYLHIPCTCAMHKCLPNHRRPSTAFFVPLYVQVRVCVSFLSAIFDFWSDSVILLLSCCYCFLCFAAVLLIARVFMYCVIRFRSFPLRHPLVVCSLFFPLACLVYCSLLSNNSVRIFVIWVWFGLILSPRCQKLINFQKNATEINV